MQSFCAILFRCPHVHYFNTKETAQNFMLVLLLQETRLRATKYSSLHWLIARIRVISVDISLCALVCYFKTIVELYAALKTIKPGSYWAFTCVLNYINLIKFLAISNFIPLSCCANKFCRRNVPLKNACN